jgi:hypothetical protein
MRASAPCRSGWSSHKRQEGKDRAKDGRSWEIREAFKIEKGEIHFVEAVMTQAPYGMKPGWPD